MCTRNGSIEHKRTGKEVKIGRYYVDGFDSVNKIVYEYNGCVFHGCPACQEPEDTTPFSDMTMAEAYESFETKRKYLEEQGYQVVVMWSCEWRVQRLDPAVAPFVAELNLTKPLVIKEAFKGGRTNANVLFYECKEGETISHIDIVSLYPTGNKHEEYPIGHPEITLNNFKDVKEYFGIIKCKVKCPPVDLFPVLPVTMDGKLVFHHCQKCTQEQVKTACPHNDDDRYLEGTWCTPEIHFALEHGYQVVEVYEVWHWDEKRPKVFAAFIDKFLKIKTEASGWPAWCTTDALKQQFIDEVRDREGIELEWDKMVPTQGSRQ